MSEPGGARPTLQYRSDIEGLRAIAILLVVIFHAHAPWMPGGFLGVDVFFVLSGFLITGLLLQEMRATGRISLSAFWARRARRLLPAAAVVTVFVLVANAVLLTPFEQVTFANTARAFAVYGSNILFAVRNADYFAASTTHDPLLHTWSLSVEEQFYLLYAPAMMTVAYWVRSRSNGSATRLVTVAVTVASVVSLAFCLWSGQHYPTLGFYLLPSRIWEFGAGALTFVVVHRAATVKRLTLDVLSLFALIGLIASARLLHDQNGLTVLMMLPAASTALLLFAGAGPTQGMVAKALSVAPLRLLGRLSYSWYLWHWPVLVYLRAVRPEASVTLQTLCALASLIPAAISYKLVESPVRFSRVLQRVPVRVVAGAVGLAVATVFLAVGATGYALSVLAQPRYVAVAMADRLPAVHQNGCLVELLDVSLHACRYGAPGADTTVVLFGDSHAAQWFPALDSIVRLRNWGLRVVTKTACPLASVPVLNGKLGRRYTECEEWRQRAIDSIVQMHPALIVAASVRSYNLLIDGATVRSDSTRAATDAWGRGLQSTLAKLERAGAPIVLLQDTPRMPVDVPNCLLRHMDNPNACHGTADAAIDTVIAQSERVQTQTVGDAHYLSMNDLLCDASWCPAIADGVVRYRDTNHLSIEYSSSLAAALLSRIAGFVGQQPQPRVVR